MVEPVKYVMRPCAGVDMFEVRLVRGGRKPKEVFRISTIALASTDILPEVPPTKNLFPSLTTVVPPTNIADTPVAPVAVNVPFIVAFPSTRNVL